MHSQPSDTTVSGNTFIIHLKNESSIMKNEIRMDMNSKCAVQLECTILWLYSPTFDNKYISKVFNDENENRT